MVAPAGKIFLAAVDISAGVLEFEMGKTVHHSASLSARLSGSLELDHGATVGFVHAATWPWRQREAKRESGEVVGPRSFGSAPVTLSIRC